jgi:hypothetical protein
MEEFESPTVKLDQLIAGHEDPEEVLYRQFSGD